MKIRVRTARYPEVQHIEGLFQEAIEGAQLPPIERPHIYHILNNKIQFGQAVIAVVDEKLAGVGIIDGTTFPWNSKSVVAVGFLIVRKVYQHVGGVQAALLEEMIKHAHGNNVSMIYQRIPGIDVNITDEEMILLGATIQDGAVIFLAPEPMESQPE